MMYILSAGCQWAALPKDLPPRSTVNNYLRRWDEDWTLGQIHHTLYMCAGNRPDAKPARRQQSSTDRVSRRRARAWAAHSHLSGGGADARRAHESEDTATIPSDGDAFHVDIGRGAIVGTIRYNGAAKPTTYAGLTRYLQEAIRRAAVNATVNDAHKPLLSRRVRMSRAALAAAFHERG
jgi:transposase